jgi:hypothetical protein
VERLLYRLSKSSYKQRLVLKGAMLFITWEGWSPRPTRDVDFLGRGADSEAEIKTIFQALCRQAVAPDGLTFDPDSVRVDDIREDQAYGGKRVRLRAMLGEAQVDIRVDIGFGDAVTPAPQTIAFPTLLNLPAPDILAYPRETVVAEKLEAMVRGSLTNFRVKDYYDLALLARQFSFEGALLAEAIAATFQRRGTPLPAELPKALTSAFVQARQTLWDAFLSRDRLTVDGQDFEMVVSFVAQFLWPPAQAAAQARPLKSHWPPGGPWRKG